MKKVIVNFERAERKYEDIKKGSGILIDTIERLVYIKIRRL